MKNLQHYCYNFTEKWQIFSAIFIVSISIEKIKIFYIPWAKNLLLHKRVNIRVSITTLQRVGFSKRDRILTTFSLACTSRIFLRARTCMCELTCLRVLVLPVLSFMYRAISSFRPVIKKKVLK